MLRWRLLLGVIFAVILSSWLWFDHNYCESLPGVWLVPLLVLLSILAAGETIALLKTENQGPNPAVVYTGSLAIALSPWLEILVEQIPLSALGWSFLAVGLSIVGATAHAVLTYRRESHAVLRLALTVFAMLYVGLLLNFVVQLRLIDEGSLGVIPILSLVIVVKMSDIGAYTVGRMIGRHKLAPELSPGKTLEGLAGGVAFACLAAGLVWWFLRTRSDVESGQLSFLMWMLFAPAVTIAGVAGDLAESMLKRDAGQKDSSSWMPGFGGVLDLLDSILISAPIGYLFWASGLLQG